jgi:hypothetical protein
MSNERALTDKPETSPGIAWTQEQIASRVDQIMDAFGYPFELAVEVVAFEIEGANLRNTATTYRPYGTQGPTGRG